MDDKTPTPDQTPDHTPHHSSESVPDAQTVPVTPTSGEAPHPTGPAGTPVPTPAQSKPGRKRALLIGGGIAAAVVLAGGGIAIGAAISDEFGDGDRSSVSDDRHHDDSDHDTSHEDSDRDDGEDRTDDGGAASNVSGPAAGIGTASADELIEIADAARSAADGDVTSIDATAPGKWS